MTDLPEDDEDKRRARHVFNQLVARKAHNQGKKQSDLIDWKIWYSSLNDNERARVDEQLGKRCDEIAAQFGKPRQFPRS